MTRFLTVGAAQMGPVSRNESRADVVLRLLEMLREAKGRGCDLVVFTECALTPFFPRWWEEEATALDPWFEREMPGPDTQILFHEAKKLGIGFHLGYAELTPDNGQAKRYNSSVLVGADGQIIGKYRKIHLPGATEKDADNPHGTYEKRYFDTGNLGFRAWRAFGGVVGMCLGNDRRWPEAFRVLGLQGAEMILLGYNTAADHPDHPELDYLTNFHSTLSMQAGAYHNGCFVIGVAKAGNEEGINQIGRTVIIAPSGEVVTQCTTLKDELAVHRCNLDQARFYKDQIFRFADFRRIEAYSLITQTPGPIPPLEPGQDLDVPREAPKAEPPATEVVLPGIATPEDAIQKLLVESYGYDPERARHFAEQAKQAQNLGEKPKEETPAEIPPPKPKAVRALPADPIQAIREVLKEEYRYSDSQIDPIAKQVVRALELKNQPEPDAVPEPTQPTPKPKTLAASAEPLTQAEPRPFSPAPSGPMTEIVPTLPLPVAEDIGWLPGRFPAAPDSADRVAACVHRLMQDYRYSEEQARKIADLAEIAWLQRHPPEPEQPPSSEPAPTTVYTPETHPRIVSMVEKGKPLTQIGPSPMEKTFPSLSSEDAFHVYSVLTEKYGYSSRLARGIAERANSAARRWQSAKAEAQSGTNPPKETPKPSLSPTVVAEPPPDAASEAQAEPGKTEPSPESADGPYIIVHCPECEFPLKFDQSNSILLGRKARCPKCQTKFRLPESV